MNILETKRLILRVFEPDDLDDFAPILADPESMKFYSSGPVTREQVAVTIGWFIGFQQNSGFSLWAVIHKPENRFLGYCGLLQQTVHENKEFEIAYNIDRHYWGQGIATEAARAVRDWGFAHLDAPRLISIIDPLNIASIRVAEKNGMRYVDDAQNDGRLHRIYAVERGECVPI